MLLQYVNKSPSSECLSNFATLVGMTTDLNEKKFCSALALQHPPRCDCDPWPHVQDELWLVELKTQQWRRPREGSQHPDASLQRAQGSGSWQKGLNKARAVISTLVPTACKPTVRLFPLAGCCRASVAGLQLAAEGAARKGKEKGCGGEERWAWG